MNIRKEVIMQEGFVKVLEDLMVREMPIKKSLEISESIDVIAKEIVTIERTQQALAKRYGKKDDKGELVPDANGKITFATVEDRDKCESDMKDLVAGDLEIPLKEKIVFYDDENLTPQKARFLKDLIVIEERPKK